MSAREPLLPVGTKVKVRMENKRLMWLCYLNDCEGELKGTWTITAHTAHNLQNGRKRRTYHLQRPDGEGQTWWILPEMVEREHPEVLLIFEQVSHA